jgi:hypothetical protein
MVTRSSLIPTRGYTQAASADVEVLISRAVKISMTSVCKSEEKGCTERLMSTIKEEEVHLSEYEELQDALRGPGTVP